MAEGEGQLLFVPVECTMATKDEVRFDCGYLSPQIAPQ